MLCSNCKKRDVEVLIKQVINHEVHNLNLCRICAEEMGFISPETPSITISFSMNENEAQKARKSARNDAREQRERAYDDLKCSSCGMEYIRFREKGFLGCPVCYNSFRFPLGAYLQKEQGAESHWGGSSVMFSDIQVTEDGKRISAECGTESEAAMDRLKNELSEAISCEEYERAAELRDAIFQMESGGNEKK